MRKFKNKISTKNKLDSKTSLKNHFFSANTYLKTYLFGLGLSFLFVPFFAFAATTYSQDLFGLFEYLKDIINDLVLWLFTTGAVLLFLGGLTYKLYQLSNGEKVQGNLKQFILPGLIALTVMFTFYAIVGLIAVTFGIRIGIPQFFKTQDGLSPGSGNINRSYSVIGR